VSQRTGIRIGFLIVLIAGVALAARYSGLATSFSPEVLSAEIRSAGFLGLCLFAATFSLGLLAYLPGTLFIVGAVYVYGWEVGGAVALLAGTFAVSVNFVIARSIAGSALTEVSYPLVRRLCAHIEESPLRNVILLRLFFNAAPVVNHALALSPVRFRHYVLGSAIGMAIPMFAIALLTDLVV